MTLEARLFAALDPINERGFPDVAPTSTPKPYWTFQQIGGPVINPLNGDDPGKEGATVQVNVWATTRKEAKALIKQFEAALRAPPVNARPVSASFSDYDHDMELYGSQQEFTLWF